MNFRTASSAFVAFLALALISAWAVPGWCTWQTFSTADGLANNQVTSVLEDRSENLWFGTHGGVSRYDGVSWRTFTTADGLALNDVRSMLEDRSGNLWFGTRGGGVSRYDGSTWRTFTTADGLAANDVISMLEDRSGNLWFGTLGGGVSRYDGASWRTFTTADGLATDYILSMLEDRLGNLWFGGELGQNLGGVSRYDGSTWRTFTTADGLAANEVNSMLADRSGNLWFGTGHGVSRYDGASWRTFTTADGLAANSVASMLEDRSGNLWFGTSYGGVSRYDGSSWRTFTIADGLANYGVTSTLADRSGNLWFGTYLGVSRYDGASWRTFTAADGLAGDNVSSMLEDQSGNLWFGTYGEGVSRYDGLSWRTFTTADGLSNNNITCMLEDRSGNLWFGTAGGVSRYDGSIWRTFTTTDGVAADQASSMLADRSGNLWFGTYGEGVSRYDGSTWRTFTTADGLIDNYIISMLEDRSGNLWFGTVREGVSRYDGSTWRTFTTADGLADNDVTCMLEDQSENLWFGTSGGGVSRYDGASWRTFTPADGLAVNEVTSMLEDRSENLWFGTAGGGVSRYEPDRVAPQTVFLSAPPRLTPARNLTAVFVAGFGEADRIKFSYRLDAGAWSSWSPVGIWYSAALADGIHTLEAVCRDFLANTDLTPAKITFEVDATPPNPVIASPTFGQAVRQSIVLSGTTADTRFLVDSVWVRPAGAVSWVPPAATLLAQSSVQVSEGALATWDTSGLPDGGYDIRLAVTDSLGLTGTALASVIVDNHAPYFDQTAPAKIPAATGGDVYTTNAEAHLYFPPHAFVEDATVMVTAASAPASLPGGGTKILDGYEIAWAGALKKPARFTLSYAGVTLPQGTLALYRSADGNAWERLGGTVDARAKSVSLAVSLPGRYALFVDNGLGTGASSLSGIAFTPRVFSPTGAFADRQVGISFRLGRPAPVTVKVFSRSGRLIREVATGVALNAGENLVRWDGTDRNGGYVVDGMYLVSVEALGHTETKTLAVVK